MVTTAAPPRRRCPVLRGSLRGFADRDTRAAAFRPASPPNRCQRDLALCDRPPGAPATQSGAPAVFRPTPARASLPQKHLTIAGVCDECRTQAGGGGSMGELMSQLSSQTSRLIRDEMRLAQKEFLESAKHAGLGAGLFSVAGLLAFFGLATFITAGVAALSLRVARMGGRPRRRAGAVHRGGHRRFRGPRPGAGSHANRAQDRRNRESRYSRVEGRPP